MVATLKTGVIQEPSSATVNLTLDASGGVTVGQNLTVAGTTTFTGGSTFTGNATAAAFIPSGSTVPTNGLYRPAANTVGLATNSTNALYIDSSQNVGIGTSSPAYKLDVNSNANINGTAVMSSPYTMRNKIINGAMVIDQRNAGASVTTTADLQYLLDRWQARLSVTSKFSVQQNAGSVTPPAGYSNYLGITSLSAYSIAAGDYFAIQQRIEGFNTVDLAWGTASAASVTLSFWVRSSLTGTFGGGFSNSTGNRTYPFSYTISSANTWEQKSVTIAGDTTGTWVTNSGIGVQVNFGIGVGSTYSGTAGAWSSSTYLAPTGATSVVGTNGATFYITGVQLERGTVATPFEYRNYQQELAMCQRYYCKSYDVTTAPGTQVFAGEFLMQTFTNNNLYMPVRYPVPMRTDPTLTFYPGYGAGASPTAGNFWNYGTSANIASQVGRTGTTGYSIEKNTGSASATIGWQYTASAEL